MDERPGPQADGTEAGDGLARWRVADHGIGVFRRHPGTTARAMTLEVALILAPPLNVLPCCQLAEFYLNASPRAGSDFSICGRGLRSRNPIARNTRWHCRTPRSSPYLRRRCSDISLPSHRCPARPNSRGSRRRSSPSDDHCTTDSDRGRPRRSPSRKPSKPRNSNVRTQRWMVRALDPHEPHVRALDPRWRRRGRSGWTGRTASRTAEP